MDENKNRVSKTKNARRIYFNGIDECTRNNEPDNAGECICEGGVETDSAVMKCEHYKTACENSERFQIMMCGCIKADRKQLYTKEQVLEIMREGGKTDRALSEIRESYETRFGNVLTWRYPIMVGEALGTVIIPVQEGFLSIAYNDMNPDDYEIYDLDNTCLLTAYELQLMKDDWEDYSRELVNALQSMRDIQAAREKNNGETAVP